MPELPMDIFEAIYSRRDVRHFKSDAVPADVLERILDAAHHAGSVGFMQPWNFIIIRDRQTRGRVRESFDVQNEAAREDYAGAERALYDSLKLEGILEAPLNVCVTCDRTRGGRVLGRHTIIDTDVYSTCCAVQNLWLAARALGVGVGWVSILDPDLLAEWLDLPKNVVPVAYLCLGYPQEFRDKPLLEEVGWRQRLPLEEVVFYERWGGKHPG